MDDLSLDSDATFEMRKEAFVKEYGKLREKYELDFMAYPMYVQGEKGNWELVIRPEIVDLKTALVASPFQSDV